MKRSKINGLLIDDSKTRYKDCLVIDQCDQADPPLPPGPVPGDVVVTPDANPSEASAPGGQMQVGEGIPTDHANSATDEVIEVFLVPLLAGQDAIAANPEGSNQYPTQLQDGEDVSIGFGVTLLNPDDGSIPISTAYDVILTLTDGSTTKTLTLISAPGTPQKYNWVPSDGSGAVTDSGTNENGTTSQNVTRWTFLNDDNPTPQRVTATITATNREYGTVTTATTEIIQGEEPPVVEITGLRFEPSSVSGTQGSEHTVQLIAVYSDGSEAPVVNETNLVISQPPVFDYALVIDNPNINITITGSGTGTLTATHQGQTAVLNVTAEAILMGLMFQPMQVTVSEGQTMGVQLFAMYSDGTNVNVTAAASINHDDFDVFTWAYEGEGESIMITPVANGTGELDATYEGQSTSLPVTVENMAAGVLEWVPNEVTVQVDGDPVPVALQWTPTGGEPVPLDFADLEDIASANTNSSINQADDGGAQIEGLEEGTNTVRATYQGVDADLSVTITAA